jgi:ABC-type antimicrobial peptide transport system permease subunit
VDADVSVTEVTTMQNALADSLWRQRLTAWVLALFAGLAAVLAAAGIYGVFSYFVSRRVRELGIRVALGGTRRGIFLLVTGTATRLALAGIALGLIGATIAMRLLATWFRDVREFDATTVAATSGLLLLIAVLASALPAWRATRVDPVVALREQ